MVQVHEHTEFLAKLIAELETRLEPVLVPSPSQLAANGLDAKPVPMRSPLTHDIRRAADHLGDLRHKLETLLPRLEI